MFYTKKCFVLFFCINISIVLARTHLKRTSDDENEIIQEDNTPLKKPEDVETFDPKIFQTDECWPSFEIGKYFKILDKLDEKYSLVRKKYQDAVGNDKFDTEMLAVLLDSGGVAKRTSYDKGGNRRLIPAGINLGGFCMMRVPKNILPERVLTKSNIDYMKRCPIPESKLCTNIELHFYASKLKVSIAEDTVFFHRMKLRNDTHFRIKYLHNDLKNMVLKTQIALNDLHLLGSFDRAITDKDPSKLFYVPTFGQAEFLLKNVEYKMEGRYRLMHDTLNIGLVKSEIQMDDIIMVYHVNVSKPAARLEKHNIDGFLDRLKSDLNQWLKDYFNDYLLYFVLADKGMNSQFQKYDNEKAMALNDFIDNAINVIVRKLHQVKAGSVKLPNFTIHTYNGLHIKLRDGVVRGLDTMYRRSVATGVKEKKIRRVDALVAFSNLKVTYTYSALLMTGSPPISGALTLAADELVARIAIAMVKDTETVDLSFEFEQQARTESLTVEGPANRMISKFNFLIERHIIAIMSNALIHNIKMLSTLSRCVPILVPFSESGGIVFSESNENDLSENMKVKNKKITASAKFEDDIDTDTNLKKDPSKTNLTADYILWKKDSVELEFPPKQGSQKKQKMFLKYNENFALGKINKKI